MGPNYDTDGTLAKQLLRLGYGFVVVGSMTRNMADDATDLQSSNKILINRKTLTF